MNCAKIWQKLLLQQQKKDFAIDNIPFDFHVDHMQPKVFSKINILNILYDYFCLIKRLIVIMDVNMKNCRLPMKKTGSQMVVII